MSRLLLRWIVLALAVVVASMIANMLGLEFDVKLDTANDAIPLFLGVAALALLNATLGKLLKFFTIPLNCLTLGLFSMVINAGMLMLASELTKGFTIKGEGIVKWVTALVASILISVIASILGTFIPDRKERDE